MSTSLRNHLAFAALGLLSLGGGAGDGPKETWGKAAFSYAPALPDPGPNAVIRYQATWNWLNTAKLDNNGQKSATQALRYCVVPAVEIVARPNQKLRPDWTVPFEIALVDDTGAPAAPGFVPRPVPTPIKVGELRILEPTPPAPPIWCATLTGVKGPPVIFLQVNKQRARVDFSPPITLKPPTGAASSPR
jgi:hypothetical protein